MTTSDVTTRAGRRLVARSFAVDEDRHDVLDHYAPDGFAWLDGDHGFVGSGVAAVVAPADAVALLSSIIHEAPASVSKSAGPRAVGALPFRGGADAHGELVVPALIVGRDERGRAWRTVIDDAGAADAPGPADRDAAHNVPSAFEVSATTTRDQWRAMVDRSLVDIRAGLAEKIVLARAVRIDADQPFDIRAVLAFLRRSQPGCIVYADRGFVGASPELLARKVGAAVTSRPLAGTGVDTDALVRSAKDAHEHRLVVDAVVRTLRTMCTDVCAAGPSPLELADVSHLATTVTASAPDSSVSIADIVAALHPTPAVAGTPRQVALDAISALETVPRGRYAGPCGWIDRNGDGEFVVALRGGAIAGNHAVIHAGAGIVTGSDPDAEWAETQQKLTPMLQALVRP
ncbi:MAG TPA: isochorismate synthase [Acidimicrobiia bacterium]|jgi:menaquinone-specific isochorismate synthase|nr:isochorismate synthase [Acidimicrobiia bacterium]